MQNKLLETYCPELPSLLRPFLEAKALRRLRDVGMNCGVEYTSLPFFSSLPKSSRFSHSLGVALLSYRYSRDKKAALSGLFHDIATPCFAHTIDFLKGDYESQTKTEEGTASIIAGDETILRGLQGEGLTLEDVSDYTLYPVCDNVSPRLSADRLEYTLRNIFLFGYANLDKIGRFCADLSLSSNEFGESELQFSALDTALDFAFLSLRTSEVYICKEDRFAMDELANTLRALLSSSTIDEADLMLEEGVLLSKIMADATGRRLWSRYTRLIAVEKAEGGGLASRPVASKIRYIDPYVKGLGRVSELNDAYKENVDKLRKTDFGIALKGKYADD